MSDTTPIAEGSATIIPQISRRQAMQWVMAVAAAAALPRGTFGKAANAAPAANGYGYDPNLVKVYQPGAFWPLTFNAGQHEAAAALADIIIPKDALGPAASEVGVPAFLDEWISAPYPIQEKDRPVIIEGLAWLEGESQKRFKKGFAQLANDQKHAICDDIAFTETAKAPFKKPAMFFDRFRSLCAAAYYATPEGWTAIGYVGNVILTKFDGPPPEVLAKLGVLQTVAG
jgi:hypothetical protein